MKPAVDVVLTMEWMRNKGYFSFFWFGILNLLSVVGNNAVAQQIPIGTWRVHPSLFQILQLETAANGIIYGSSKGGFFSIDATEGNQITRLGKADGFSSSGISALRYNERLNALIIGYLDGNIDILKGNTVYNIDAIARATTITGNKAITHISFAPNGTSAYLSSNFGLIELNIAKNEIRSSNQALGNGGTQQLAVYATAATTTTLYVCTNAGVLQVPVNATLQNSANYSPVVSLPSLVRHIGFAGKVLVAYTGGNTSQEGIYIQDTVSKTFGKKLSLSGAAFSSSVSENGNTFRLAIGNAIIKVNSNGDTSSVRSNLFKAVSDAAIVGNTIYIADSKVGIMVGVDSSTSSFTKIQTNSPFSDGIYKLTTTGNKLYVAPGGIDVGAGYLPSYNYRGYSVFDGSTWLNYNQDVGNFRTDVRDILFANLNTATNLDEATSFGNGLIQQVSNTNTASDFKKTDINSIFQSYAGTADLSDIRLTSFCNDLNLNTWYTGWSDYFSSDANDMPLYKRTIDGTWSTLRSGLPGTKYPVQVLIADNNDKWVRFANDPGRRSSGPIMVINDAQKAKFITDNLNAGGLPTAGVNDMAKDADGAIWLATDKGLAAFYSPATVLASTTYNVSLPIFSGRPLLETESLSAIEIDGGGRKWIGTKNKGVYLYNKELTNADLYFNTDNSPLPSNNIQDIAIDNTTGEVYIATDLGLISYRGSATEGNTACADVIKVFPNPVRPSFKGQIGISGLSSNAMVKIVDCMGRLTFEGKATGGTFAWDGKDYNGRQATSGVYFVLSASEDGQNTCVSKLAIVD